LHSNSVTPKLEYAVTVWNSVTSTDARKLERTQRKLEALRQYRFFTHDNVTYGDFLQIPKLLTFDNRRLFSDYFFVSVYSGLKYFLSLFDITDIRALPRIFFFRHLSLFIANGKNSPSARCASAANRVWKDIDIFGKYIISLKQILL